MFGLEFLEIGGAFQRWLGRPGTFRRCELLIDQSGTMVSLAVYQRKGSETPRQEMILACRNFPLAVIADMSLKVCAEAMKASADDLLGGI